MPRLEAQKENWSFSDRTGIKGIQVSFGVLQLMNKHDVLYFHENFTPYRNSGDSIFSKPYGKIQKLTANLQFEIVYAPFRFNSRQILRNLELMAGLSYNGMDQEYKTEVKTNQTPSSYDSDRDYYLLTNNSGFLNLKAVFNFPVASGIAAFGSLG